jgi:SsrA-binding protein
MAEEIKEIANNKKARFEYEIEETFEAGLVLKGTEVKSLRLGKANINDAYGKIINSEAFVYQMNISVYDHGNRFNHDPMNSRKLLLHKKEIKRLTGKLQEQGYTLVALKLYFKKGKAKLLLGLGRGKTLYDKRQSIQKKEADRELQRAMKNYRK